MRKKLIGMLVCAVVAAALLMPTGAVIASDDTQDAVLKTTPLRKFFVFGIMQRIESSEHFDFEITLFTLVLGGGSSQKLNEGEMIRLYGPMIGIATNNMFIGVVSDWSVIG